MYKPGETVIVTAEDNNQVGVVLDRYIINKKTVHDVLLENRTALIMLSTTTSKNTYINKTLTERLCNTGMIKCTVPYKDLLESDSLPICRA